ncbi:MAG: GPW/gp25 family protein [Bacteroidetes bacterium]|nr:GPW/gp25 family protein [Bacteroidota bacterium]
MDNLQKQRNDNFLGTGWAFPVSFSSGNYQLITSAYEKNINESIDLLLQTIKGERPLSPAYGSGLRQFVFNKMDETLRGRIIDAVFNTLRQNEPRITVTEVAVNYIDMLNGQMEVLIAYEYNQTNTRHNYVFPFSIKEGTSL